MRSSSTAFVIRLDDIGRDMTSEIAFIERALSSGLRVSCGVVPMWLSDSVAERLRALAAAYQHALEIHVHGYAHVDYRPTLNETKYEFGPARSFEEQLTDIRLGFGLLRKAFGPLLTPVFSPPFGEYDDNTVLALHQCGLEAISGLRPDQTLGKLVDFPGQVDLFRWDPPREKGLREIIKEWEQLKAGTSVLIVHPGLMCQASAGRLISLLLRCERKTSSCLFRDLLTLRARNAENL